MNENIKFPGQESHEDSSMHNSLSETAKEILKNEAIMLLIALRLPGYVIMFWEASGKKPLDTDSAVRTVRQVMQDSHLGVTPEVFEEVLDCIYDTVIGRSTGTMISKYPRDRLRAMAYDLKICGVLYAHHTYS